MHPSIALTDHARIRSQQRAVPVPVIEILMQYGHCASAGQHCQFIYLDKKSLHHMQRELPPAAVKALEKKRDCYLVLGDDGAVITVGHRTRKILH